MKLLAWMMLLQLQLYQHWVVIHSPQIRCGCMRYRGHCGMIENTINRLIMVFFLVFVFVLVNILCVVFLCVIFCVCDLIWLNQFGLIWVMYKLLFVCFFFISENLQRFKIYKNRSTNWSNLFSLFFFCWNHVVFSSSFESIACSL